MGITKRQLEKHDKNIGSSELFRLLFQSFGLFLEKTGRAKRPDLDDKPAIEAGKYLEPALLNFAEDKLGSIVRNQERRVKGTPILCHIDGIVKATGEPIECKARNILHFYQEWGKEETGMVPPDVVVQCQGHIMSLASRPRKCNVPYFGGKGFVMYYVDEDKEVIAAIKDASIKFWDNIKKDQPPDNKDVDIQILKRIQCVPNKVAKCKYEDIAELLAFQEQYKAMTAKSKEYEKELLLRLGDAEALDVEGYDKVFRVKTYPKARYVVKKHDVTDRRWVLRKNVLLPAPEDVKQIEGESNEDCHIAS